MIVVVFRSRLDASTQDEYQEWAARTSELAKNVPGYVSHKGFVAADGERVTVVEFEDEAALRRWAVDRDHVDAKKKGRASFFTEYKVQVCSVIRQSEFARP